MPLFISMLFYFFIVFLFYFIFTSAAFIYLHYYDRQVRRLNGSVLISVYRHEYYAN